MKFLVFLALATLSLSSFAVEPICKSLTGRALSLEVVYDGGPSYGNVEEHNSIKKRMKAKFDELCKSSKTSREIITEMYNECYKATDVIKKQANKERYLRTCDGMSIASTSFMEGIELAEKAEKSEKCENPGSVSSLDRSVKEISDSVKKKDVKKSKASAQ